MVFMHQYAEWNAMSLVPAIVAVCVVVIDRHDLPTLMLYVTPPYLLCKLLAAQLIPSLVRGAAAAAAVCVCVWHGHVGQLVDHDAASQIASPETARTSRGWEGLAVARATRHVMTTHHEYVLLRPPIERSRVLNTRSRGRGCSTGTSNDSWRMSWRLRRHHGPSQQTGR